MSYKMVVCDCDNTLIDRKGYLPKDNIKAIRKIMAMGVEFVIASGRNDLLVLDYANEIGGDITLIGCNGATVRNLNKGETYRNEVIPPKALDKIFGFFELNNLPFKAYTIDSCFAKNLEASESIKRLTGKTYENKKEFKTREISRGDEIKDLDILKIIAVDRKEKLAEIQKRLKDTEGVNVVFSAEIVLDIISDKASKGSALFELAKIKGIKPEEIVAFGDSENDLSMLKGAGLSVCMGNGEEEVKRLCHMTTKTNNEAGVAWALNEIFGLNMY